MMRLAILAVTTLVITGCSLTGDDGDDVPKLLQFKSGGTPDELSVVSSKPLVFPNPSIGLQPPLPNGQNRADQTPRAEAIAKLGGNPAGSSSVAAFNHRNLTKYSTRFGYDPVIRQRLESEDLAYRKKNDGLFLERVFNVNVYYDAYLPMSIDPYVELQRLRNQNVRTPAAPPKELK